MSAPMDHLVPAAREVLAKHQRKLGRDFTVIDSALAKREASEQEYRDLKAEVIGLRAERSKAREDLTALTDVLISDRNRAAELLISKADKAPFKLVVDEVSHDTVECLEVLLEKARTGEVIGVAFGAMLRKRGYIVDTAGELHRNPTFARGVVAALDDKLSTRIRPG